MGVRMTDGLDGADTAEREGGREEGRARTGGGGS